jgi:hypothetical protein
MVSLSLLPLFLFLLHPLAYASPAPHASDPLHFPLSRRAPAPGHDLEYYKHVAEGLRAKYGFGKPKSSKRASADISLTNQQIDASYFAVVNIGTP